MQTAFVRHGNRTPAGPGDCLGVAVVDGCARCPQLDHVGAQRERAANCSHAAVEWLALRSVWAAGSARCCRVMALACCVSWASVRHARSLTRKPTRRLPSQAPQSWSPVQRVPEGKRTVISASTDVKQNKGNPGSLSIETASLFYSPVPCRSWLPQFYGRETFPAMFPIDK